jgi:hypothetical protein
MTKVQAKKVASIQARFFSVTSHGRPEGYEFKKNEVTEEVVCDRPLVFVYLVTGRKSDEGTLAEIYCRSTIHTAINATGKVTVFTVDNGPGKAVLKKHYRCYYK